MCVAHNQVHVDVLLPELGDSRDDLLGLADPAELLAHPAATRLEAHLKKSPAAAGDGRDLPEWRMPHNEPWFRAGVRPDQVQPPNQTLPTPVEAPVAANGA